MAFLQVVPAQAADRVQKMQLDFGAMKERLAHVQQGTASVWGEYNEHPTMLHIIQVCMPSNWVRH